MTDITTKDLIAMFVGIASAIEAEKGRLSELDGVIGDADHGVTMSIGFSAVNEALGRLDHGSADPATVLSTSAKAFLNAVGATSGPLYASAFIRAAAAVKGRAVLDRDAVVNMVTAMVKGIRDRGKADRGDKTMIDAWLPAAEAVEAARLAGRDLSECLDAALFAAQAGAEATKSMVASKGRASRLGERAIGHMDPGAASAVVILGAIGRTLGRRS
ncbi:MAG: dihydroxyacetone kinase subunit DhaL [Steroidobacteraceae bacterium]|jgi:dihydroxyacetone kinase-like protein